MLAARDGFDTMEPFQARLLARPMIGARDFMTMSRSQDDGET